MKVLQKNLLIVCVATGMLVGCASKATTVDGATVAVQSRTIPERMTDFGIQRNIVNGLSNISGLSKDNVRVAVTSFRGEVLLTGEVPNQQIKADIERMALSIREVKGVYNYLEVTDTPKSQSHSNHEKYLQTKIRTKLIGSSLSMSQYALIVRSDVAYIMGEMTKSQQDEIVQAIRETDGIKGIVLANKILSTGEINNAYANTSPNTLSNAGYDGTAVYPNNAVASPNGQYNPNTGYPNSMYTNNGQPSHNVSQAAPTYQPPVNQSNPNAGSGYVQLYQGTNKP